VTNALHVTQVLHCNLNTLDLEGAAALYERGLALATRMRSETTNGDSTAMGIEGSTHSLVRFLYDHRGGHISPAVELMEWCRPPTAGVAYEDPTAVGLQALVFAVRSVADAVAALGDAGASVTGRTASVGRRPIVDAELLDRDGVRLELVADHGAAAPTLRGVRLSCFDLDESAAWYGELGWVPAGERGVARWSDRDDTATVLPLALATHPFRLELTQWSDGRSERAHELGNSRGLFRMALAVDDVQAAYRAATAGARVEVGEPEYVPLPGTPLGGLWVSFFRDPNGVMVELVERVMRPR
jgi:catechol 2,3-dioxygenase-like lactoylglutathione lyase family enzyme